MDLREFLWRVESIRPGSLPDLAARVPPPSLFLVGDGLVVPWPPSSLGDWVAHHELVTPES